MSPTLLDLDRARLLDRPSPDSVAANALAINSDGSVSAPPVPTFTVTKLPTSAANDATVGTVAWVNATNAETDDNAYATDTVSVSAQSQYLKVSAFLFSIPSTATILGIGAAVKAFSTAPVKPLDVSVKLVIAGAPVGTDHATNTALPAASTYLNYGGPVDLWGLSPTPAQLSDPGFGLAYSIKGGGAGTATVQVDAIRLTVYYQ